MLKARITLMPTQAAAQFFNFHLAKVVLPLLTVTFCLVDTIRVRSQNSPSDSTTSQRQLIGSGSQVSLNNQTLPIVWHQWQNAGKVHTAISDAGVMQLLGVELLDTKNLAQQPVQWFSPQPTQPLLLKTWLNGAYRYLDVTPLVTAAGWQISTNGNTLSITTPAAKVQAIRQGKQTWGERIVVDLDRPTPWQIAYLPPPPKPKPPANASTPTPTPKPPSKQEWEITIQAGADPALRQTLAEEGVKLATAANSTTIRFSIAKGLLPRVSTLANPNRLVIDIRPDAMVNRDILWAEGLRYRQQYVNLGGDRFPVVWLETNPRFVGLTLKPIWSESTTLVGTAPLIKTAPKASAVAAINGGFFNRNNQFPLGAIRRDGNWISSPILNRGAIAWNEQGGVKIGRLSIQEHVITANGQRLPISTFNSGYVQSGMARYSPAWGRAYTPGTNNETIIVVDNNQVTAQLPGGEASKATFAIPANGYLLVNRGDRTVVNNLPVGSLVQLETTTIPAEFSRYPQIVGAGPLLIQNRQIVLNAQAEGFSDAFIREKAIRSAICTTATGSLLIAAVHNRAGGAGATLSEVAKVMQQMGCVDALNLDGGSSTSLYLGGQLVNRSPRTAARVHNGIGIFLTPPP